MFFFLIRWSRPMGLVSTFPSVRLERGADFPSGNSWAIWALVASLAWLPWNCVTLRPALDEGCSRGVICPSVTRADKRSGVRHQRHRNSGVSFVLWACDHYNSPLKWKGMLPGRPWALSRWSGLCLRQALCLDLGFRDGEDVVLVLGDLCSFGICWTSVMYQILR